MNDFEFHRPASVAQALQAIAGRDDARFLAGGQSLLPSMKLGLSAPTDLVDLSRIAELAGIRVQGGTLVVGAATTHAAVAASADVARAIPALARVADGIGDRAVRALGTLGGSLATNDPAGCYPAAVLGLGAAIRTDRRTIPADDFFTGLYETALAAGELVVAVEFPLPERAGWVKFKQPASRFSLVGVFASRGPAGVRVAVTGAGACVFRVPALEAALTREWSAKACEGIEVSPQGLNSDLHASAEYRAHLIPVLCRRAVAQAG